MISSTLRTLLRLGLVAFVGGVVLAVLGAGVLAWAGKWDLFEAERDLEDAVYDCDRQAVSELIHQAPGLPLPIVDAARCEPEIAHALLDAGVDITADDPDQSPLYVAIDEGRDDTAALLIEAGADVAWSGPYSETALHAAAERGSTSMIGRLLDAGAPADPVSPNFQTPLFRAVATGEVEAARMLLFAGADPNRSYSVSWIDVASFLRSLTTTRQAALLASVGPAFGLRVDVPAGRDPFEAAIDALGSSPRPEDPTVTPLYVAVLRGSTALVSALVDAGADLSIEALPARQTPLQVAEALGDEPLVRLLEASGAPS